jgi:hypothetical protein
VQKPAHKRYRKQRVFPICSQPEGTRASRGSFESTSIIGENTQYHCPLRKSCVRGLCVARTSSDEMLPAHLVAACFVGQVANLRRVVNPPYSSRSRGSSAHEGSEAYPSLPS